MLLPTRLSQVKPFVHAPVESELTKALASSSTGDVGSDTPIIGFAAPRGIFEVGPIGEKHYLECTPP